MPWFVLYTRSRNEKLVAEKLRAKNIEVYCPLIKKERKWSDRIKVIEEPLFRSYCFVNLAEQERNQVFDVPGIVRYLFWLKKPAIVREAEIEAIRLMLNEVNHKLIVVRSFNPGERLKVGSGSFANFGGEVIRQDGKLVSIQLDSLQAVIIVDMSRTIIMT